MRLLCPSFGGTRAARVFSAIGVVPESRSTGRLGAARGGRGVFHGKSPLRWPPLLRVVVKR